MNSTTILLIIAVIVFLIIPSFKDRNMPIKRLIIMPAMFIYLLYQTSTENFSSGLTSASIMVFGLMVGTVIGAFMRRNAAITADKQQKMIGIPGGYTSLIVFLLIFSAHFLVGYLHAVDPQALIQEGTTAWAVLFLLSATAGLTVGTSLCLYIKYQTS